MGEKCRDFSTTGNSVKEELTNPIARIYLEKGKSSYEAFQQKKTAPDF